MTYTFASLNRRLWIALWTPASRLPSIFLFTCCQLWSNINVARTFELLIHCHPGVRTLAVICELNRVPAAMRYGPPTGTPSRRYGILAFAVLTLPGYIYTVLASQLYDTTHRRPVAASVNLISTDVFHSLEQTRLNVEFRNFLVTAWPVGGSITINALDTFAAQHVLPVVMLAPGRYVFLAAVLLPLVTPRHSLPTFATTTVWISRLQHYLFTYLDATLPPPHKAAVPHAAPPRL